MFKLFHLCTSPLQLDWICNRQEAPYLHDARALRCLLKERVWEENASVWIVCCGNNSKMSANLLEQSFISRSHNVHGRGRGSAPCHLQNSTQGEE